MTDTFKPGDFVVFRGDPEKQIFQVSGVNSHEAMIGEFRGTVELEGMDGRFALDWIPPRLLEKAPEEVLPLKSGSIIEDGEADLWVTNGELWEHLTYFGENRFRGTGNFTFGFDQDLETIKEDHGGFRVIYRAP